ncbi:type VI secretion system protein TssA [Burkholderiaceae bacterium UC74_6]
MTHVLNDIAFAPQLGLPWAELLAPVDPRAPAGTSLRADALYHAIQRARSADDASLPMGQMPHELKHADWPAVQELAVQALCRRSKDLQLCVWLLEALMQQHGLAGIAPGLRLSAALLDRYWEGLHPLDAGHRANLLRWVNRRLLPTLKLIPLNRDNDSGYAWSDLELAQRLEQQRGAGRNAAEPAPAEAGLDLQALQLRLTATPLQACQANHETLCEARRALALLIDVVDARFESDAPSLGSFAAVLESMQSWFAAELRRRGQPVGLAAAAPPPTAPAQPGADRAAPAPLQPPGEVASAREQAYLMLARAADTLLSLEPHSPVPYVVQRAIAWGGMNTAELYRELFVRAGGQIHIFELLGIAQPQDLQDEVG